MRAGRGKLQGGPGSTGDVRGRGLMVAVEFSRADRQPDAAAAKAVQRACLDRNLLLLTCGSYENIIRWIPPLVVTGDQINAALAVFGEALKGADR